MHKKLIQEEIEEIRKNPDKANWFEISYYKTLSEDFIREFSDKIYWTQASYHQKLSEKFIQEFSDKVHWDLISWVQTLSKSFIYKFYDKVCWPNLIKKHNFHDAPKHIKLYIAMNHRELLRYFK